MDLSDQENKNIKKKKCLVILSAIIIIGGIIGLISLLLSK